MTDSMREGVSMSRHLVDRALSRNTPAGAKDPPRVVLAEEEQRILFKIRLGAMARTGHHKTMVRLLGQVLQDSRAVRTEEEVYERNRPAISS